MPDTTPDFMDELGSFTPRQLVARLTEIAKTHGDIVEDTQVVRTYVLASGSARLSASTYPLSGVVTIGVLYGRNHSERNLTIVSEANGRLAMTLD